ncbi:MAG: hypothetical protein NW703_08155 [Nitrospiraceae bacterium]
MSFASDTTERALRLSGRITLLPLVHGSGDMAQEVRETLIMRRWDCLAVPLPPSAADAVETGLSELPAIHLAVVEEPLGAAGTTDATGPAVSFIPIDPCQAVVMGLRVAIGEGVPCEYIDREVTIFESESIAAPDPYALKTVSLAAYAASLVAVSPRPELGSQRAQRIAWMAFRLHELELEYGDILCLCSVADWPWLREAYLERSPCLPPETPTATWTVHPVSQDTLYFVLGELPFLTELYERRRADVRSDRYLAIDGLKELLLETRSRWMASRPSGIETVTNWVTPQLLQVYLQYVRNLALLDRRLTPDLYTLVLAAKQIAGDDFAIQLLETAKRYAFQSESETRWRGSIDAGIGRLILPDGRLAQAKNRLAGMPLAWRSLSLRPVPKRIDSRRWGLRWDPFRQCSWPPEDQKIESFASHVRDQARALMGADLAKVEKFTTSLKDGIDLRESLRNWTSRRGHRGGAMVHALRPSRQVGHRIAHPASGPIQSAPTDLSSRPDQLHRPDHPHRMDIYVKEVPPARGQVEIVVFLFETPADPDSYTWKATWYAEHQQESTLCFFATDFLDHMIGPGIAQSKYGGALFLYPPRPIPDIWTDRRLDGTTALDDRLIAAAAMHSRETHIALVSPMPPSARWRRIARHFNRRLLPIPLGRFSAQTVDRLRTFHVLNGHEVRSYASRFIREVR